MFRCVRPLATKAGSRRYRAIPLVVIPIDCKPNRRKAFRRPVDQKIGDSISQKQMTGSVSRTDNVDNILSNSGFTSG